MRDARHETRDAKEGFFRSCLASRVSRLELRYEGMSGDPSIRIAELERQVAQLTEQHAAALRELEAFAYAVSHDLRAPLRSLSGFSQALLESLPADDPKTHHHLLRIQQASRKMSELIDALLALSRIARAEMHAREMDLTQLCGQVASALKAKHPARIIHFTITPGLHAYADQRLIRTALEALLDNAVKFSASRAEAHIAVRCSAEGVFEIADNGIGFDMAYIDKLFKPFQRLHAEAEFPGIGTGLATAFRVVARHNGRIWLKSTPDGTTAFFVLNARQGTPAPT